MARQTKSRSFIAGRSLAERERFELSIDIKPTPVFETGSFNHSDTSPNNAKIKSQN